MELPQVRAIALCRTPSRAKCCEPRSLKCDLWGCADRSSEAFYSLAGRQCQLARAAAIPGAPAMRSLDAVGCISSSFFVNPSSRGCASARSRLSSGQSSPSATHQAAGQTMTRCSARMPWLQRLSPRICRSCFHLQGFGMVTMSSAWEDCVVRYRIYRPELFTVRASVFAGSTQYVYPPPPQRALHS